MVPSKLLLSTWRPNSCIPRPHGMQVPARFIVREGDDDELRVGNNGRPFLLPDLLWTNRGPSYWQVGALSATIYVHACKFSIHAKHVGTRICMLYGPCQGGIMEHCRFLSHDAAAELLIKAAHLKLRAAATCWDKWPWSDCGGALQAPQHVCQRVRESAFHEPTLVSTQQGHYTL